MFKHYKSRLHYIEKQLYQKKAKDRDQMAHHIQQDTIPVKIFFTQQNFPPTRNERAEQIKDRGYKKT